MVTVPRVAALVFEDSEDRHLQIISFVASAIQVSLNFGTRSCTRLDFSYTEIFVQFLVQPCDTSQ